MTRDELIERIKFELGWPTVKVEVDETAWNAIISRTLSWFKAKKGLIAYTTIASISSQTVYDYPTGAEEITEVIFPTANTMSMLTSLCFFDVIPVGAYSVGGVWYYPGASRFDSSQYVQMIQSLEQRRRIFNSEPGWYTEANKIFITTQTPMSGNFWVFYKKTPIELTELVGRDEDLAYRYALATTKLVLGRTLRKYSQYPTAGGSINTDGAELIADAKEEIEKLEEEIIGSQGNAGGIVRG